MHVHGRLVLIQYNDFQQLFEVRYTNVIQQSGWEVSKQQLDTQCIVAATVGEPYRIAVVQHLQWWNAAFGHTKSRRPAKTD